MIVSVILVVINLNKMIDIFELNQILPTIENPENFDAWNQVREDMFVHTRGALPEKLLCTRRPNEDENVFQYRLSAYEPITKGSMNRAIDKLFRIFQGANFSIQVSESLDAYLSEKTFRNQYFYDFIQKYVVRRMIEDPNAVLAWIPSGPGLVDPSVKVDVEPVVISSENIKFIDHGVLVWFDPKQKSEIRRNGKRVKEGEVYFTLTADSFYKHVQTGSADKKQFEVVEVYRHEIGVAPFIVLGGNLTPFDYFESFFSSFLPFANEAIRQYSDWQGVMTMSAFPYREEVAEDCDAKGCRGGVVYDSEKEDYIHCDKCQGSGKVFARGPYGVFLRAKGNAALGESGDQGPLVRFVSPPVDIIKYSGEAWETLLRKAESALNLIFVEESQSGIAKTIDREESDSMLIKISNNIFDNLIFKSLLFIETYRELNDPVRPVIVKPISFRIRTEEDLINEINSLNGKNAPVAFQVEAAKDLARKRFSGNKILARMVEILVAFDPIYHVSTAEKSVLLAAGTIKKTDVIKSLYAYKTLTSLVAENGSEYLEKPLTTIFADLEKALEVYLDEGPVISIAEEQALEAQAKIRGSVGGVQGIIAINRAVSAGEMTEEAAETILQNIYGIGVEEAARMVDVPAVVPGSQTPAITL